MVILPKPKRLDPFVKEIILLKDVNSDAAHRIPIYADGFPGLLYGETDHAVRRLPDGKILSDFYLFGQTIEPITLAIEGAYSFIVFQLYPFAPRLLLGVNPKTLNDDCYDLLTVKQVRPQATLAQLKQCDQLGQQVDILADFLFELVKKSSQDADHRIKLAVNLIISAKGHISIRELREQLFITERTFERHFAKEIGVTPKQFAKIIQFNFSLHQIKEADYASLTEVGYDRGFSDQSHFIKTFKRYTGKTPREFQQQLSA